MLTSRTGSIEDLIFRHLQNGAIRAPELVDSISAERPGTTKQGVYAALRNLKKREIVLENNKQVLLSVRWLKAMEESFAVAQKSYFEGTLGRGNFYNLGIGESVEYSFRNPTQADAFWWHVLYLLAEMSTTKEPVYLYNPHDWFLIARRDSERESVDAIVRRGKFYLMTVGGNDPLDRAVAKGFDGNERQYHMAPDRIFPKNSYYLNVVDDFLVEVWIEKSTANAIDAFYKATTVLDDAARERLARIVEGKGHVKLRISRDPKKAAKLKARLGRNFYRPRNATGGDQM